MYYIKFKSSLRYKDVLNDTMLYLMTLMMTSPKFLKDPKNN